MTPRPDRQPAHPRHWLDLVVLAVVVLSIAPLDLLLPKTAVKGRVQDSVSSDPIAGARVRLGATMVTSDQSGVFEFERASLADRVQVQADGYQGTSAAPWPPRSVRIGLVPAAFALNVRDAETGEPVAGVVALGEGARFNPDQPGRFQVQPARVGLTVTISAPGYQDSVLRYQGGGEVTAPLQPRITGTVLDGTTGQPVPGAFLGYERVALSASADGTFELASRPSEPIQVLAPGYRRAQIDASHDRELIARLEPITIHALYLTYYGIGDVGLRQNVLALAGQTEVNAVVIDVKGERGKLAYRSAVPFAEAIGANDAPTVPNVDALLATLKQRGLYTIARISVFKDDLLARNGAQAGADVAVRGRFGDQLWLDADGLGWVDPLQPAVVDYNIELAKEAARMGFDEVQFDSVRFPTEPSGGLSVSQARYSQPWLEEPDRIKATAGFLRRARDEVNLEGAFVGADVMAYATWNNGDNGVGQDLVALAGAVDYLCPMVYPSSFRGGLPDLINFPRVVQRPYDAVYESLRRARARADGQGAVLRPWLQYFDDYAWQTGRAFRAADIEAERQGAYAAGASGWMMWDPSNRYARGGLGTRQ